MKNQLKFQKIIVKTFVIFAAISVFYSLIFATPFYQLTIIDGEGFGTTALAALPQFSSLTEIYEGIQPFNQSYFYICIASLLVSLTLLIFFCQSRRLYYVSNYIVLFLNAIFGMAVSLYSIINILIYRIQFTSIDFESIFEEYAAESTVATGISSSTWTFDIGIILFVVIFALSGALIANAIWKMLAMKQDKKEFGEIDAQIRQSWADHQQQLLQEAGLDES